jgi:hypothetical protein
MSILPREWPETLFRDRCVTVDALQSRIRGIYKQNLPTRKGMKMVRKSKLSASASRHSMDIGIGAKDRRAIIDGLSRLLADTYTLYLTTRNFTGT